jgi:hypothetical protein
VLQVDEEGRVVEVVVENNAEPNMHVILPA